MHETTLAKRYALALASLAAEQNQLVAIGQELNEFLHIVQQTPTLRALLTDPTASLRHQLAAVRTLLDSCRFSPLMGNFLQLLVSKGRMVLMDFLVAAYQRELETRSGRVTVHVTTPTAMSQTVADRFQAVLSQTTPKIVHLECHVQPELMGGAVIRIDSLMVDYSVRSKLNRLKASMKG